MGYSDSVNQRMGVGQVRPQEHFLNRDTHTHIGAPALVPFELIQT